MPKDNFPNGVPRSMRYTEDLVGGLKDLIRWIDGKPDWVLVEIGSWVGESTMIFAESFGRVVSIDPFDGFDLTAKYFRQNCAKYNIEQIRLPSVEASRQFVPQSIDVVYIDANHHYEYVKNDILHWLPIVKDGGVICGHDYNLMHKNWPKLGIQKAVRELLGEPHAVFKDDSWAVRINPQKAPIPML